jgi:hypothetical protein
MVLMAIKLKPGISMLLVGSMELLAQSTCC